MGEGGLSVGERARGGQGEKGERYEGRVRGIEKVKERKEVGKGWKGEGARVWVKKESH